MVDIAALEKSGYSRDELKAKFTAEKLDPKIEQLIDLNAARIDEGMRRNLDETRIYRAIDEAFNVSQQQVSYTLVKDLVNKKCSYEEVQQKFTDWGLTNQLESMIYTMCGEDGKPKVDDKGNYQKAIDLPTFFHIFLPLVSSYTKLRSAKLFNDRDQYPIDKYEPLRLTKEDRLRCQIVTSVQQRSNSQMGLREHRRHACQLTPKYGSAIAFPLEDYYVERQKFVQDEKLKEVVVREGVRWSLPHPTRRFWDQNFDISTINTDTGCTYLGYWTVRRWGDIANDKDLWNTDRVTFSYGDDFLSLWNNVAKLTNQCSVKFPAAPDTASDIKDRYNQAYRYTTHHLDAAVSQSVVFHKLVPKDWGLYDYEYPVWHRLVFAGPRTVVDCRPWAYTPGVAYLYDYDLNEAAPNPLALELLPFQDHLSNLISQYILSVQSNLDQAVFVDVDQVDPKYIEILRSLGEKRYKTRVMVPFRGQEYGRTGERTRDAFQPVVFEKMPVEQIAMAINQLLGMMERMLGFSAQELGQAASHEQSAHEVRVIQSSTGERLRFTGGFIDSAIWAQKQRNYEAFMAYGSDEVIAEVAIMHDTDEAELKKLGFEIESPDSPTQKRGVKGSKKTLRIDAFASPRDGQDRIIDEKIGAQLIQVFQSIFTSPVILEAAGIPQVFDLFNQALGFLSVPDDYRLRLDPEVKARLSKQADPEVQKQQTQEIQAQIAKIAEVVASQIADQKVAQVAEQAIVPMQQVDEQIKAALVQLKQSLDQVAAVSTQGAQGTQQIAGEQQAQAQVIQQLMAAVSTLQNHAKAVEEAVIGGGQGPNPAMAGPAGMPTPPPGAV